MFCTTCGKEQEGNQAYCTNCGAKLIQDAIIQPGLTSATMVDYAGFWRRVAAWIIDSIILGVIVELVSVIIGFGIESDTAFLATTNVLSTVIGWLYFAIMESTSNQATLGKMALSIVVTDEAGNRISFARATGRHFAKILSALIFLIGFFMIAFTQKKQGLHDMIAGTLVVQRKR